MSYVFFGTSSIAALFLRRLIRANMLPTALVTNPDRPAGRKRVLTAPETKRVILEEGLENKVKIFQPEKPADIAEALAGLAPDLFVVLSYGHILPEPVLALPRFGVVGVHPSLLPKYRGPSPIQSVLLAGESETGVALYKMGEGMDDGPVYAMEKLAIGDATHDELTAALADLAARMVADLLPKIASGDVSPVPQSQGEATFTRKFTSADGFVDQNDLRAALAGAAETPAKVYGKIRAFTT